jgi:dihydrofolate reductase
MGKIVSNFFIALDGVVEAPNEWHFPYFDDAMGRVVSEGMQTQSAFLMGRRLYDEWSAYWPGQGADVPFSSYINNLPKYVLTHRPIEGGLWNNTTVLGDDPVRQVQELKDGSDGDIGMSGCVTTVRCCWSTSCSTSSTSSCIRSRSARVSASSRTPPRCRLP